MKQRTVRIFITLAVVLSWLTGANVHAAAIEKGVSRALATERAAHVSDIHYSLTFTVPERKEEAVTFMEIVRFTWNGNEDLQLDFQGSPEQLEKVIGVNGKGVKTVLREEHIVIPKRYLREGENIVEVIGRSGDKALNRSDEYLYTLFVPDHARSVFPCFDQPDLKAQFALKLSRHLSNSSRSFAFCREFR